MQPVCQWCYRVHYSEERPNPRKRHGPGLVAGEGRDGNSAAKEARGEQPDGVLGRGYVRTRRSWKPTSPRRMEPDGDWWDSRGLVGVPARSTAAAAFDVLSDEMRPGPRKKSRADFKSCKVQDTERDTDRGGRGRQLRGGLEEDARRSLIQCAAFTR